MSRPQNISTISSFIYSSQRRASSTSLQNMEFFASCSSNFLVLCAILVINDPLAFVFVEFSITFIMLFVILPFLRIFNLF
ncbi:hypothetical protein C1645_778498 [Glomus cerebriforme]|uniref:Uncharacterized protein n=1 Tax=Glomus cerebriforme TaxID=658196 RepID=A0A397SS82_9GLOM|nr:hypothetical protein C1645_778498 [Glomus cerebriforme]